jgi:hypothetical protein
LLKGNLRVVLQNLEKMREEEGSFSCYSAWGRLLPRSCLPASRRPPTPPLRALTRIHLRVQAEQELAHLAASPTPLYRLAAGTVTVKLRVAVAWAHLSTSRPTLCCSSFLVFH